MSHYFADFGASSAKTQELSSAVSATTKPMLDAIGALNAAEAALAGAVNRLAAAKALRARLEEMDADWFKRVADSHSNSGPEWELYSKYAPTFPLRMETVKGDFFSTKQVVAQSGPMYDFDAESPALDADKEKLDGEISSLQEAIPGLKIAKSAADSAVSVAQKAVRSADDKYNASVKADEKAAVDLATAQARATQQAQQMLTAPPKSTGVSPLIIAAIAVPVVGAILYAVSRKSTSVAGYRRRRSRR